jgi:hypothetical protein
MEKSQVARPVKESIFTPKTFENLLALKDKKWTVSELFGPQDLMMVFGDSGAGKSFVVVDLIVRGTRGMCFANDSRFRCDPFRTLYCTEEGLSGLKARFKAAFEELGDDGSKNFGWLDVVPSLFGGTTEKSVNDFLAAVKEHSLQPDLVVMDTLADAILGAEENDNGEATFLMLEAKRIATELNCAVCFVHHTGKADKESMRGASAFRAKMDLAICIKSQANPRTLTCDKFKEGERWGTLQFNIIRCDDGKSAIVEWDSAREVSGRQANTDRWQASLIETLRDNATSSEGAMSVRQIIPAMSFPTGERTVKRWLDNEAENPKSPIEMVKKQTIDRNGKRNNIAEHYWINDSAGVDW